MSTKPIFPSAAAGAAGVPRAAPALPETGFLRESQVLRLIPVSKSTLWRRVRSRTFPAPLKLSPGVTVWRVEDVRGWIQQQPQNA